LKSSASVSLIDCESISIGFALEIEHLTKRLKPLGEFSLGPQNSPFESMPPVEAALQTDIDSP